MVDTASSIAGASLQKMPQASEQIDSTRKNAASDPASSQADKSKTNASPHAAELLQKIKALTENGTFAVQFETDNNTGKMVVQVVNSQTKEVVRQIPPESLLNLEQALTEYSGNFVDTTS